MKRRCNLRELVNTRALRVATILAAVLGAYSCGSEVKEFTYDPAKVAKALNDCAARSNAARAALLKIKDALASGSDLDPKKKVILDPPPVYVETGVSYDPSWQKNTAILTEEALADVQSKPSFDLRMEDSFLFALQETKPGNQYPGNPISIRADCDEGFAFRYLIVIRTGRVQLPVELPKEYNKFTPGTADIDLFLTDMTTQRILARVEAAGASSDNIKYKLDRYNRQAAEEALKSDLIINTKRAVAEALTKATDGKFAVKPNVW
ncbi:MAG TPA: hypothetical protein VKR61_24110 [Bryobacteraceae bacterium]|nr:hypothetical protein [Bryobacteraceae bacterium]